MQWAYMREEEFVPESKAAKGLCVLPLGCSEKHGEHLPVGCDSLAVERMAILAAEKEEACVFPCAHWLGDVMGVHRIKDPAATKEMGFVSLNPHTLYTILEELCCEIARNGFRKILIVNGHGGNKALIQYLMRGLYYEKRDFSVMTTLGYTPHNWLTEEFYQSVAARREKDFPYLTDADLAFYHRFVETGLGGAHADVTETAYMMATCPEYVDQSRIGVACGQSAGRSRVYEKAGIDVACAWRADFPDHYCAYDHAGVSETFARMVMQISVERLAGIYKVIKENDDCLSFLEDDQHKLSGR